MPAEAIILTSQLILQRFKCRSRCTGQQYFLTTCSCGVGDTHHPSEAELHDSHSSWWRYHRCDKMTTALVQRLFGLMNAFHFDHSSLICQMWDLLCLPFLWVSSSVYSDKLPQRKIKKKQLEVPHAAFIQAGGEWKHRRVILLRPLLPTGENGCQLMKPLPRRNLISRNKYLKEQRPQTDISQTTRADWPQQIKIWLTPQQKCLHWWG